MISRYFFKAMIYSAAGALSALALVFSCADAIVRLSYVPSLRFMPQIMGGMLGPILLLVSPLALALGAASLVAHLYHHHEIVMIYFLSGVRQKLYLAAISMSMLASVWYVPLIMYWAPHSYWQSKQIMMHFACHELDSLAPGQFHHPVSGVMIYFDRKLPGSVFKRIIIRYQRSGKPALIVAESGNLYNNTLYLRKGVIMHLVANQEVTARFARSTIALSDLFGSKPDTQSSDAARYSQMKYLRYHELRELSAINNKAWIALHGRYVQILWLFVLPLCGLWGMLSFSRPGSPNMVLSLVLDGLLFLFSYINISFASAFWKHPLVAFLVLYASPVLLGLFMYGNYRKKFFSK